MNCIYLDDINNHIFDISCIGHILFISYYKIFRCIDINHNTIEFIKQVSIDDNISKKIRVNTNMSGPDVIK